MLTTTVGTPGVVLVSLLTACPVLVGAEAGVGSAAIRLTRGTGMGRMSKSSGSSTFVLTYGGATSSVQDEHLLLAFHPDPSVVYNGCLTGRSVSSDVLSICYFDAFVVHFSSSLHLSIIERLSFHLVHGVILSRITCHRIT